MRLLYAIILSLTLIPSSPVRSQDDVEDSLTGACSLRRSLSKEDSDLVDKYLLELDKTRNVSIMAQGHVELLQQAQGALNFCELERRLRKLEANTYLIALPYEDMLPIAEVPKATIVYPYELFFTWSPVPRYAVWYELKGLEAATKKIEASSLRPADNLHNLNRSGIMSITTDAQQRYVPVLTPDPDGLNQKYSWLHNVLAEYKKAGNLSYKYNPWLMDVISHHVAGTDLKGYTLNEAPSGGGYLQFFVIDKDPKRILRGYQCNCGHVPDSNLIICDKAMLEALLTLFNGTDEGSGVFSIIDDAFADFLIHWVVGHEIGHFIKKHSYSSLFMSFEGNAPSPKQPDKPIKAMEMEADEFAFRGMPDRAKSFGHQVMVQLIVRISRTAQIPSEPVDGQGPIKVKEEQFGHPNFLSRAYTFVDTIGTEDFFIDKVEKNFAVDFKEGFRIGSVCDLNRPNISGMKQ